MSPLEHYSRFFASLNKDFDDVIFEHHFAPDCFFKDPFQEVKGVEKIISIFRHMYATLKNPRFEIIMIRGDEFSGYIEWNFYYNTTSFSGVSRVEFNLDGKVTSHVDYWDAASNVYEKIPLLGIVLRFIKQRLRAHQ